jgi:hypothetical protein
MKYIEKADAANSKKHVVGCAGFPDNIEIA